MQPGAPPSSVTNPEVRVASQMVVGEADKLNRFPVCRVPLSTLCTY